MRKRYLVTGGAGFIGSHIVDALIKRGDKVTVIDNLSTGKKQNLNPKATFVKADIRNLKKIRPYFKKIDGVFHAAALPRVQPSIKDPITTHDTNVNGTLNALWAAKKAKVKRFVYSASSSAYGNPESFPSKETLRPRPLSPYGLQKYIGEEYCRLFAELYGMETVALRYFNVYGPRMAEGGAYLTVIKTFLNQRAAKKPLTIVGDGAQTRDFTNVFDVVQANLLAMERETVGQGEVINVGPGQSYSVKQVAAIIGGPVAHLPARIEPKHSLADNALARTLLGWEPRHNLPDSINKFLTGEWK